MRNSDEKPLSNYFKGMKNYYDDTCRENQNGEKRGEKTGERKISPGGHPVGRAGKTTG